MHGSSSCDKKTIADLKKTDVNRISLYINNHSGKHTYHGKKFVEIVLHRRAREQHSSGALERGQRHGRPRLGVLGWAVVGIDG